MADTNKQQNVSVQIEKDTPAPKPAERPLTRFEEMERDVERLFEQLTGELAFAAARRMAVATRPEQCRRVAARRRDRARREIVVRAELPGVEKKDLDVSLTDRAVTIKASTRRETKEESGDYHRREISTGYVSRVIALPSGVDVSACKAEFKDGILELEIPKQAKATRVQVDVK